MDINIEDQRGNLRNELKSKFCCRFCLTLQKDKLDSIYMRNTRIKSTAPLTVQIMACTSLEVFSNDDMPSMICFDCRLQFEYSYRFQQMCKRAENLLRQYPLTGQWPSPLLKPAIPQELIVNLPKKMEQQQQQQQQKQQQQIQQNFEETFGLTSSTSSSPPKLFNNSYAAKSKTAKISEVQIFKKPIGQKILLNANPAESPEPPIPKRFKKEKYDLNEETTIVFNKVENNEELSMDDVHRLVAATESSDEFTNSPSTKPKLLNKSTKRILNKEVNIMFEPRLSTPMITHTEDGHVEIVTEILDSNIPYETETNLIKNAEPVETNVFPCPHCDRSFPLRQLREIHMVNHNRERSFQCTECDKSFFSKYDLQKHVIIHSGDRPFKCTVCNKGFTRTTLLHRHERTHADIPKLICVYCEKQFISKEELEKHTERHKKNRPYKCKICEKAFAFKQGLERHEIIHLRDQPFPCQYCDLSFATPSKLARHLTAHAGKRPYPCKLCSKSYLLSHHLTRHMRGHRQNSGTFKCNNCKMICKTREELIKHSSTHARNERSCALCKEKFNDIDDIMAHIQQHADIDDNFACEFCDCIFFSSDFLQTHIDECHAEDMVAYHEDDKAQMDKSNKNTKTTTTTTAAKTTTTTTKANNNNKNAKTGETKQGSFEEFYVEANIFGEDNAEYLTEEKDEQCIDILETEEIEELEELDEEDEVKYEEEFKEEEEIEEGEGEEEDLVEEIVKEDDEVEEEEEEEIKEEYLDDSPPTKIRKVANYNKKTSPRTTNYVTNSKAPLTKQKLPLEGKQKLMVETPKLITAKPKYAVTTAKATTTATKSNISPRRIVESTQQQKQLPKIEKKIVTQNQISKQKLENTKQPLINSVLSSLPKGITARRTGTAASGTATMTNTTIITKINVDNEKKSNVIKKEAISTEKSPTAPNRVVQKKTTPTSNEAKSTRSTEKAVPKGNVTNVGKKMTTVTKTQPVESGRKVGRPSKHSSLLKETTTRK